MKKKSRTTIGSIGCGQLRSLGRYSSELGRLYPLPSWKDFAAPLTRRCVIRRGRIMDGYDRMMETYRNTSGSINECINKINGMQLSEQDALQDPDRKIQSECEMPPGGLTCWNPSVHQSDPLTVRVDQGRIIRSARELPPGGLTCGYTPAHQRDAPAVNAQDRRIKSALGLPPGEAICWKFSTHQRDPPAARVTCPFHLEKSLSSACICVPDIPDVDDFVAGIQRIQSCPSFDKESLDGMMGDMSLQEGGAPPRRRVCTPKVSNSPPSPIVVIQPISPDIISCRVSNEGELVTMDSESFDMAPATTIQ